jgi:hypothetical protein
MTAMMSCERRKKRGALVTFNTHLLLENEEHCQKKKVAEISREERTPLSSSRRKHKLIQ